MNMNKLKKKMSEKMITKLVGSIDKFPPMVVRCPKCNAVFNSVRELWNHFDSCLDSESAKELIKPIESNGKEISPAH